MIKNYFTIAWRYLLKNKAQSFINIAGLSIGMAVALLIGLWIMDEYSYDRYNPNYGRIAQVMLNQTHNGETKTQSAGPVPLGPELRKSFGNDLQYVVMSSWIWKHTLANGDKTVAQSGSYMDADAPRMLSLKMLKGSGAGLDDPHSVLLSQSAAKALFANTDPTGQAIVMDNNTPVTIIGVYEDLPANSDFSELSFIAPWNLYTTTVEPVKQFTARWDMNGVQTFVQLAPHADLRQVSEKIKNTIADKDKGSKVKTALFLHPLSRWHLFSEFKNGVNTGGLIQYVWLFGGIGFFVLLLACINFMNLSTARSEKRAKEVGIRKAVGSLRKDLITQFFIESMLMAFLSLGFALLFAQLALPFFNEVAGKKIVIQWSHPLFWITGLGFALLTGVISGCYPALYLSRFKPAKVLKGTFKAGRFSAMPRKVLVVLQFTVSVILITGTIIVVRQIQYAKDRPVGYQRNGLLTIGISTPEYHDHFAAMRTELLQTGAIAEMAEATSPPTAVWNTFGNFKWKGKDPNMADELAVVGITPQYGTTLGWEFTQGRSFSTELATDSSTLILNEAAVKYMGLKNPIGEIINWSGKDRRVIGVIRDMVMQSPYAPVKQTVFYPYPDRASFINVRISPNLSVKDGISRIETVFKRYAPSVPVDYTFADEEYAKKFAGEERISKLAASFAFLAIFISCLGLLGMAAFMAEQRTREIGIRKVLGASVLGLWGLLSRELVALVVLSCMIATPIAWYYLSHWLQRYAYRTTISGWVFGAATAGALALTLVTVSIHTIRAALANPVKSLKVE